MATKSGIARPHIHIPAIEGTLFGPVTSVRNADDAKRAINRLLGRN